MPRNRTVRSTHNVNNSSHGTMECIKCHAPVVEGDYGVWTNSECEHSVIHRYCCDPAQFAAFKFAEFDAQRVNRLEWLREDARACEKIFREHGYEEAQRDIEMDQREIEELTAELSNASPLPPDMTPKLFLFTFWTKPGDYRPTQWPVKYPFWCVDSKDDRSEMMAYVESKDKLLDLWPDAFEIEGHAMRGVLYTRAYKKPSWIGDPLYKKVFGDFQPEVLEKED